MLFYSVGSLVLFGTHLNAAMLEMEGERDCTLGDDAERLWLCRDE